jgi:ATP-dependent Lon protease
VLPIGGVRNKVLAAHRSGLKTVVLPKKNEKDLVDVPKKAKSALNLVMVKHIEEVLDVALLPEEKKGAKIKTSPAVKPKKGETKPPVQPGV